MGFWGPSAFHFFGPFAYERCGVTIASVVAHQLWRELLAFGHRLKVASMHGAAHIPIRKDDRQRNNDAHGIHIS